MLTALCCIYDALLHIKSKCRHQQGLCSLTMLAGRRATRIKQQRFEGTVFSWKPESGYGFIDVAQAAAQVLVILYSQPLTCRAVSKRSIPCM